jgi:hypothetical protein
VGFVLLMISSWCFSGVRVADFVIVFIVLICSALSTIRLLFFLYSFAIVGAVVAVIVW